MEHYNMNLTLKVWRQINSKTSGSFETYKVNDISSEMSFLEMFDVLNEQLIIEGNDAITFDHDCREGICGACVAACVNSSAMLFVSAKVSQLALLPQGGPERESRVLSMVAQMDKEGFGNCTNTYACEAECPKGISVSNIARLNREYLSAGLTTEDIS
jgi:succinate dehydrogenase/fumarate reductase-like Fe-S protein